MLSPLLLVASAVLPPHPQDPREGEVPLPCADGWQARLVLENGDVGVWTVAALPVFDQYASPEVVGLDDEGRCWVIISYAGKWNALPRVHDGRWLGGLAHGDVDPRQDGAELYVGSEGGNLYQVVPYRSGALDARLIAELPGLELHTLVARGREVLVFTNPGHLYRSTPTGPDGRFVTEHVASLPARVRDAILLPAGEGATPRVATAARDGGVRLLDLDAEGAPRFELVHRSDAGAGRLALRGEGDALVLYSAHDDGRILRHARSGGGWTTETIYAGPQGARGVAVGRFHADPSVESVAVFGYSAKVQLVSRTPDGPWRVETIFVDRDRGHWLAAAELDGRNGTDELVGAGYGGRIFLLARPPGFALPGAATDPEGPPKPGPGD